MTDTTNQGKFGADPTLQTGGASQPASAAGAHVGQNDRSAAVASSQGKSHGSSQLAGEAREVASHVTASAQGLLKSAVDKRASQGADDLREVAEALRQSTRELKDNMAGPYVERAAERIDQISHYLRTASPGRMLESVAVFARRDPVLFLSGAFAVGLLGSRLAKSGHHQDDESGITGEVANRASKQAGAHV